MTVLEAIDFLGIALDATPDQIRRAYLKLTKHYRPERDPEGFQRLRQAYELLQDGIPAWVTQAPDEPVDGPDLDDPDLVAQAIFGLDGADRAREPVSKGMCDLRDDSVLGGIIATSDGHPARLFHRAVEVAGGGDAVAAGRLAQACLDEVEEAMLGSELSLDPILEVVLHLLAVGEHDAAEALYHRTRKLLDALQLRLWHMAVEARRRIVGGLFVMDEHLPRPVVRAIAAAELAGDWAPVEDVLLRELPDREQREILAFLLSEHAPLLFSRLAEVWPYVPRRPLRDSPLWVWFGAAGLAIVTLFLLVVIVTLALPSTMLGERHPAPTFPDGPFADDLDRMAQTVCEVEPGAMPVHHRMRCADAAQVQGLVMAGRCEQAREAADKMGHVVIKEHEGGFSMRSRPGSSLEDEPTDVVYRWARRKADRCRSRAPSPR